MKKNGFTLVELLAGIVIIALITLISSVGINGVKNAINQNLWDSNKEFIESAAKSFGEDKKAYIMTLSKSHLTITVQTLLDRGYLNTKDTINYKEDKNYKVIINKTVEKSYDEETNFINGYYVNNANVDIYIENDVVYAKYSGIINSVSDT